MPASEPIMQPSSLPVSEPVTPIPPPEPIQTTQPPKPRVSTRRITTPPAPVQKIPVIPVITARQIPVTPVPAGSVRIIVEKPDFSPLRVPVVPAGERGDRIVTSWKFCIDCGAKNPAHARFCQSCKSRQA
jgi:hypothetical protein